MATRKDFTGLVLRNFHVIWTRMSSSIFVQGSGRIIGLRVRIYSYENRIIL